MGSNKSDRLKDQALQQIMQQNQTTYQKTLDAAKPGPVEEALNKRFLDWNAATSDDTPLDVGKLPGMSPYMNLYQRAAAGQKSERTGLGSLRMGAENADPNLSTNLARYDKLKREQDAGGELESAYANENAAVTGTGLPLVGAAESRDATKLGATANAADTSLGAWSRFQIRPGFWQQAALQAMKSAGDVASAYYTG